MGGTMEANKINLAPGGQFTKLGTLTFGALIAGILTMIIVLAGVIFFVVLVVGGVRWILSGGDKAQTEAARNQITAALVGLVIVFAAWAIAQLVGAFFNIDLINFTIPNIVY